MPGFEEGYPGLACLIGAKSGDIVIEWDRAAPPGRRRLAAAMSVAIMKGDVEAVAAALSLLGVRPSRQAENPR